MVESIYEIEVKANLKTIQKQLDTLETKVTKTSKKSAGIGSALAKGITPATIAVTGLTAAVGGLVSLYSEQEQAEIRTVQTLKATGAAAGLTANELFKMASGLQDVTTYGDEAIIGAQNLLLTFRNIGGDVFPAATETVLNLSTAMGTDLKSSAIQLGKALNDPITGLTALQRVGITFDAQQKNQIKTFQQSGEIAKAQKIILAELEAQFGGVARAATTGTGALQQTANILGDVGEIIGKAALPGVLDLNEALRVAAVYWRDLIDEKTARNVSAINEELTTTKDRLGAIETEINKNKDSTIFNSIFGRRKQLLEEFGELAQQQSELQKELKVAEERDALEAFQKDQEIKQSTIDAQKAYNEELRLIQEEVDLLSEEDGLNREQILRNKLEKDKLLEKTAQAEKLANEKNYLKASESLRKVNNATELKNATKFKAEQLKLDQISTSARLGLLGSFGNLSAALVGDNNKLTFALQKAGAIAQTIVATNLGAAQALALGPLGIPVAATIKTAGYINLAAIAATTIQGLADGGLVTGGSRSPNGVDTIPAMLQTGELVTPRNNFDEVVESVARQRGFVQEDESTGSSENINVTVGFTDDAIEYIETKLVERNVLGVN